VDVADDVCTGLVILAVECIDAFAGAGFDIYVKTELLKFDYCLRGCGDALFSRVGFFRNTDSDCHSVKYIELDQRL
jgi:hypothetical protein